MSQLFPLLCFTAIVLTAKAQPAIEWQRALGGSMDEIGTSAEQTSDDGFVLCGTTYSNNGDVSGNHGNGDIWLVKLDAEGQMEWQRTLGGSQPDIGRWAGELPGTGYLVLGSSRSNDGDVSGNHGLADIWLAKLDMTGEPIWQRSYGGSLADVPFAIKATLDGGWIIAGESRSSDGDVTSNAGSTDYWVVKLDVDGDIEWQRSYGGSSIDTAYDIDVTSDGGYILNGGSMSNDGDITGAFGEYDYWVVKLDALGGIEWQRSCGGGSFDLGASIVELNNGTYAAFGLSSSSDGDVFAPNGLNDLWMAELSSSGEFLAGRSYGGSSGDAGASVIELPLGGLLCSGSSSSSDGDLSENNGLSDGWLVRTDASGTILWQLVLGGSQSDAFGRAIHLSTGGFVICGNSASNDGDVPGNQGGNDIWIVKLGPDPVGVHEQVRGDRFRLSPNPAIEEVDIFSSTPDAGVLPWSIVDRAGRLMIAGQCANRPCRIDVRLLDAGEYSLLLYDTGRSHALPFVKL